MHLVFYFSPVFHKVEIAHKNLILARTLVTHSLEYIPFDHLFARAKLSLLIQSFNLVSLLLQQTLIHDLPFSLEHFCFLREIWRSHLFKIKWVLCCKFRVRHVLHHTNIFVFNFLHYEVAALLSSFLICYFVFSLKILLQLSILILLLYYAFLLIEIFIYLQLFNRMISGLRLGSYCLTFSWLYYRIEFVYF